MPAYLSPGIYTRETDFSFYVKQISTSAAAMVGITQKGPVNKPVLVTSWEQFINKFGSYINEGYLAYATRAFFDNGGSILYICRVAHYTDITDKGTLSAVNSVAVLSNRESMPELTLQVNAANPGTWGDRIAVTVEDGSLYPANAFNLIVKYKDNIVEVFKDLSMDEASASHVELMVNEVSDYITVSDLSPSTGTANDRPAVGSYPLIGGGNGLSGMTDSDYIGEPNISSAMMIRLVDIDGKAPSKKSLAEMSMRDRSALRQEMARVDAGIDTTVEVDCDGCGTRNRTRLEAEPAFLFPGVRL